MDGSAFRGIKSLAMLGVGSAVALYAFVPAAAALAGLQIAARLATGTWYQIPDFWTAYGALTAGWLFLNVCAVGIIRFGDWQQEKRRDARHQDFMRLRKHFYAENEVCLDNYERLKERAAAAGIR